MKINSFQKLQTQRLVLRKLEFSDDNEILQLRSNQIVTKFIDRIKPTSIKDAKDFIHKIHSSETYHWVISLKGNPKCIGSICLWNFSDDLKTAEIGYDLMPVYHQKGFMNEALKAVLEFGLKTVNFKTIEAYTHKDNEGSKALLLKNKFVLQPDKRDEGFPNNRIYSLTV